MNDYFILHLALMFCIAGISLIYGVGEYVGLLFILYGLLSLANIVTALEARK